MIEKVVKITLKKKLFQKDEKNKIKTLLFSKNVF